MKALLPLAAAALLTSAPIAAGESSPPLTTAELATHELALQGTALALASETFQNVLLSAIAQSATPPFQCQADTSGAGSSKVNSVTHPAADSTRVVFSFYYDDKCAQKFTVVAATFIKRSATLSTGPGKVTYYDTAGSVQGSISLQIRFYDDMTTGWIDLGGTGSYVPESGAPPLDLAVNCKHIEYIFYGKNMPCQVAAVQNFPALAMQLGFSAAVLQKLAVTINFHSTSSSLVTAAQNTLTVGFLPGGSVGITGTSTPFGSAAVAGKIGAFAVFPPTPTAWTVTDADHQQRFSIHVVDNIGRNSLGTITDTSTAARLATINVDRSGTGAIRYAGKPAAKVSNWVISK